MDYTEVTNPQPVLAPKRNTALWLLLTAFFLSIAANAAFYALAAMANSATKKLTSDTTTQEKQLADLQSTQNELDTLSAQARSLHNLFNNQKNFDSVVATVQTRLYKKSAITTLQLTDKGELTLSGTVPSYEDYAKFYDSLIDSEGSLVFSKVRPTSVGKEEDGKETIVFSFTTSLTPIVLSATEPMTVETIRKKMEGK